MPFPSPSSLPPHPQKAPWGRAGKRSLRGLWSPRGGPTLSVKSLQGEAARHPQPSSSFPKKAAVASAGTSPISVHSSPHQGEEAVTQRGRIIMSRRDPGRCASSLGANSAGSPAPPQRAAGLIRSAPGPSGCTGRGRPQGLRPRTGLPGDPSPDRPQSLAGDLVPKSGQCSRRIKRRRGPRGTEG